MTVLALIVVLGVLVFVHEAGHFLAAKWAGIYVYRFSLGLGPAIKALTFRRGETEYSISWLPLGGYVKMASREEDIGSSALEGGAPATAGTSRPGLRSQADVEAHGGDPGRRHHERSVRLGGVRVLVYKNGRQIDPVTIVGQVVDELVPPGAAALKDIKPGDRILRINGDSMKSWDEVVAAITDTPEPQIRIDLNNGSTVVLPIHPDALEERLKAAQALQPFRTPVLGPVVPGKVAAKAGMQEGDTIEAVDGKPVSQWYDLLEKIQGSANRDLAFTVARHGDRLNLTVRPYLDSILDPKGNYKKVGRIGVAVGTGFVSEKLTLGQAIAEGGRQTLNSSTQIIRTVRGLFSGRISGRNVGGPIFIGQLAGESARLGLDSFLGFMALISINLAILNLLPVPVLDGGQFLFLLAEAVIRRPLPAKLRERLTTVGLVLIVLLMGLAFSNDLRRLFGG